MSTPKPRASSSTWSPKARRWNRAMWWATSTPTTRRFRTFCRNRSRRPTSRSGTRRPPPEPTPSRPRPRPASASPLRQWPANSPRNSASTWRPSPARGRVGGSPRRTCSRRTHEPLPVRRARYRLVPPRPARRFPCAACARPSPSACTRACATRPSSPWTWKWPWTMPSSSAKRSSTSGRRRASAPPTPIWSSSRQRGRSCAIRP